MTLKLFKLKYHNLLSKFILVFELVSLNIVEQLWQARQTRPNSGGVEEGHPRFDKGGVAISFYFLSVKNRTF